MPLTTNYINSTTANDSSTLNASSSDLYIGQSGIGTGEVTLSTIGRYNIDIFGDIKTFQAPKFPMLTILTNLASQPIKAPEDTWTDIYEDEAFADIKIDDLRLSNYGATYASGTWSNDSDMPSGYGPGYGGALLWKAVTSTPTASADAVIGSIISEIIMASNIIEIGFDISDDVLVGKKEQVIRKIANLVNVLEYTHTYTGDGTNTYGSTYEWEKYEYTSGTSKRLYFIFDDLATTNAAGTADNQQHEIIVGLDEFWFRTDFGVLILKLNFSSSASNYEAISTDDYVVLAEVATSATYTGYTRMSRLALIANFDDAPDGIPEGSDYEEGPSFIFGQDQRHNYTQIFKSKKYGVTGTRLATSMRFIDDVQMTRRRHLMMYKQKIDTALVYGQKSFRMSSDGMPIRKTAGLLDYGTFPIRYMKASIPTASDVASETIAGAAFQTWIDTLAYSLNAYKQGDGDSHTLLCSRDMKINISNFFKYIGSKDAGPNVIGSVYERIPAGSSNLNIPVDEVRTDYGTLRFVESPTLNYMPTFLRAASDGTHAGLPRHLFSASVNPRKVLIALDKANMTLATLRADKIEGNIQSPGADVVQEGMIGEHMFKIRFPRNFAFIDAT